MKLRYLCFIAGAMLWLAVTASVSQAQKIDPRKVSAPDATCTWNGTQGNWNDSTKWSCAAVPGVADTAVVGSGTITLTADVTLGTLNFTGGTIQGSSNLVVTNMTWTGGTFTGSGTTTVNGTLDMSNSSDTLDGRTLINAGSATFGGSSVYLVLYNGAVFTNQAGASLQFSHTSSGQIVYSTGGGTFNNSGFITKTIASSGFTYIYATFNNSGSVVVANGTFQMNPASNATNTNTGTWRMTSAAATIQHSSGTLNVDGVITGTGTVQFSGGTINYNTGTYSVTNTTVSGGIVLFAPGSSFISSNNTVLSGGTLNLSTGVPITLKTVTQSGGTLTGFDDFTIATYTWSGGTLSGASTTATVNGALDMSNSSVTLDGRALNNAGAGTVGGSTAYMIMYNGAVFSNQAGASLQFSHSSSGQFTSSTGGGTFNNAGVITKTAASSGFTYIYAPFNNSGSVTVNGGTLYLSPASATTSNNSGPFSVANGATLQVVGSGTLNFTGNVSGAGTGQFGGSTVNFNSGTYSLANTSVSGATVSFASGTSFTSGNVSISGGSLSLSTGAPIHFNSLTLSGGTLTGSDSFTVGTMTWSGGTLSGASATATVTGTLDMTNSSVTLDSRTFNNAGSATIGGSSAYMIMSNGAVFNNQSGASLQFTHTSTGQIINSTGGGTFNNAGAITKTNASTGYTYIYVPFNNSGNVAVNGGTLYVTPPNASTSNHSGALHIANGAVAQFGGSGTINFTGNVTGVGTAQFSAGTINFTSGTYSVTTTIVNGGSVSFQSGSSFSTDSTTISAGTLSMNTGAPIVFNTLTESSGTLTGSDNFTIGTMIWSGGTLSGSGAATVTGSLDMSNCSASLDGRTLNNAGSATFGGSSFYLVLYNGAVFNNQAGASLQFSHSGTGQLITSTGGGTFNNSGVITKPLVSNGYTYIYPTYNQSGNFSAQGGTAYFASNTGTTGNITGTITIADGTAVQFAGSNTQNFAAGSTLSGPGSVSFQGTNINFKTGSTYAVSSTQVSGGTADFSATNAVTFGDVALTGGTLRIGDVAVTGNFTRTFGALAVLSGTVTFKGGAAQNLKLDQPTTFNNIAVNPGTTLVETVDANNATVNGILSNQGTIRKSKAIPSTAIYNFGLASATISVTVRGSLSGATVDFVGQTHPSATGALLPGRYWTIGASGNGYTVSLTLPQNLSSPSQAKVCHFDLLTTNWDCGQTSYTASSVTLAGITDLSGDWAIGGADRRIYLPLLIR